MAIARPTYISDSHHKELTAHRIKEIEGKDISDSEQHRYDHLNQGVDNYNTLMTHFVGEYQAQINGGLDQRNLDPKDEMNKFKTQLDLLIDVDAVQNDKKTLNALMETRRAIEEFNEHIDTAHKNGKQIKPESYARMHILALSTAEIIRKRDDLVDYRNSDLDARQQSIADTAPQNITQNGQLDIDHLDVYNLMMVQEACHHDISANDKELGAQSTFGKIMHGALLAAGVVLAVAALAVIGLSIAATAGASIPFISAGLFMGSGFLGTLFPALSVTAGQIATTAVAGTLGLGVAGAAIGIGAAGVNARDAMGATGIAKSSFGVFAATKDAVTPDATIGERIKHSYNQKFGN